jgi:hypothetical protein
MPPWQVKSSPCEPPGNPEGEATLVTAQTEGQVNSLVQAEALGLQVADELRRGGAH